jgi:hypothetical protein
MMVLLAVLALHGCNTVEDPFLDGMTGNASASTGNRELPVHLASAHLIGLGEMPLSLRQTSTGDATRQILVWANTTTLPGENALTLSTSAGGKSALRKGPNRNEILRTLKSEFPGVAMTIDPVLRRNAYGPYGAATGKLGDKGGCVYAWQIVDANAEGGPKHPAEVRLRYCHASMGPEVLADLLSGLSLGGPTTASPVAAVAYGYPTLTAATTTVVEPASNGSSTQDSSQTAPVTVSRDSEQGVKSRSAAIIPTP